MATTIRFRIIIAFIALASLLIAAGPQTTGAAGSHWITASTYQSPTICQHGPDHPCTGNSGGYTYTLLKVTGRGFTANGVAFITVLDTLTWSYLETAAVGVDGNGRFVYKSKALEICTDGLDFCMQGNEFCPDGAPLLIQARDMVSQDDSNAVTSIACV